MYVFITLNGPYKYVLHKKVISNFSEAKELLLAHWPAHDCIHPISREVLRVFSFEPFSEAKLQSSLALFLVSYSTSR
jgi:hypothetical protein